MTSQFAGSALAYDPGTNGIGRLSVIAGDGPPVTSSTLSYDVRGRVSEEKFNFSRLDAASASVWVLYTYDWVNNLTSISDPRDPTGTKRVFYGRNVLGQLDHMPNRIHAIAYANLHNMPDSGIDDFEYDAPGRVTGVTYGHGPTDVFTYDADGRMTEVMGSGPLQIRYQYDAVGTLLNETHPSRPFAMNYQYDRLHRLTNATGTLNSRAVSLTYGYSLSGETCAPKPGRDPPIFSGDP